MQSPATSRKAMFDADLEQALLLLDREQAKLATPLEKSYSQTRRRIASCDMPIESPSSCIYKSHSMDSGLSSISVSSKGVPEASNLSFSKRVPEASKLSFGTPEASKLSFNIQIPVRHSSAAGTQAGIYYPKYQVYKQSKCISCKDCSIFFSPSAFLKHCHDKQLGTRVECNASYIELATDNPGIQQQKLWEEFQLQINGNGLQDYRDNERTLSFRNFSDNVGDNRFSWREDGSGDRLNGSVHTDVLACKRLLQSTQNIIQGSAEKAKRRYNSRKDLMSSVSDLTNGSFDIDSAKQPVIKMSSSTGSHSSARKSLQKYLSDEKDFKLGSLKISDSSFISDNRFLNGSIDKSQMDLLNENKPARGIETNEQALFLSLNGDGNSHDNERKNSDADKEDPLKILQNAQELIQLASAKLQKQQGQSMIDWEERYQAEKKLRRKIEQKLNDIQGQLHQEQQKRQELEIELRALKLQL